MLGETDAGDERAGGLGARARVYGMSSTAARHDRDAAIYAGRQASISALRSLTRRRCMTVHQRAARWAARSAPVRDQVVIATKFGDLDASLRQFRSQPTGACQTDHRRIPRSAGRRDRSACSSAPSPNLPIKDFAGASRPCRPGQSQVLRIVQPGASRSAVLSPSSSWPPYKASLAVVATPGAGGAPGL